MNTIQLINFIASHPEYSNIAIEECDNKNPLQAIELLTSERFDNEWRINGSLEKNTLIIYTKNK